MAFIKSMTGQATPISSKEDLEAYYQCACHSDEHLLKIWYDSELNTLHFIIGLRKFSFFERVKVCFKYLFTGYSCKWGAFDDFILTKEDIPHLKRIIEIAENNKKLLY